MVEKTCLCRSVDIDCHNDVCHPGYIFFNAISADISLSAKCLNAVLIFMIVFLLFIMARFVLSEMIET